MASLSTLPLGESFSTKHIMLMLGKAALSEKLSPDDREKVPPKYIARFAQEDYFYAKAREKAKDSDTLTKAIIVASSLKENINRNVKLKAEFKSYFEQLEAWIRKADEQLAKQKKMAEALDAMLPVWLQKHRVNSEHLTRTGVTVDSPIMTAAIMGAFKEARDLVEQWKEVSHSNEAVKEGLMAAISATEAVVPQQVVKEAAQAANVRRLEGEDPLAPIPG